MLPSMTFEAIPNEIRYLRIHKVLSKSVHKCMCQEECS